MRWLRKQVDQRPPAGRDDIESGPLNVVFDERLLRARIDAVVALAESKGGIEGYVAALQRKSALFNELLARDKLSELNGESLGALVEFVFTARRRLPLVLDGLSIEVVSGSLGTLLYGDDSLPDRLGGFVDVLSQGERANRRVVWDFATELLHYREPERYPLMTRWIWDPSTLSGALRELIAGNDSMMEIPLDDSPQTHQAARAWVVDQLNSQGFYRDLHYMADIVLAKAYADYVEAMSRGMGMMRPDFGRQENPGEMMEKLLGIDPPRRSGRSRVRQAQTEAV